MQNYKFNIDFMENLLNKIKQESKRAILAGEFNLNLIKYAQKTGVNQFLEIVLSNNFMPQITLPTRVAQKSGTLLDNILINHFEYKCIFGNITSFISDHLPQFIIFKNFKENNITKNDNQTVFRDFKNLNMDAFERYLSAIDWSLATENIDTDLSFKTFLRLFHRVLDKHASLKKTTKREKKEKIKPWVTKGIIKYIKVRDKLYKKFIRSKIPQERESKYSAFKKYRNKLIGLLKISRQSHYQNYFNENKKNSRALWQGINEIINSKKADKTNSPSSLLVHNETLTNIPQMAEHFNEYFTSIGKNLKKVFHQLKDSFQII